MIDHERTLAAAERVRQVVEAEARRKIELDDMERQVQLDLARFSSAAAYTIPWKQGKRRAS